jgi:PAS domain S-box-containing protein
MALNGRVDFTGSPGARPDLHGLLDGTALLSGLPSGALLVADGTIQHANDKAGEILARMPEGLVGEGVHAALHGSLGCPGGCELDVDLNDPPKEPRFVYANFGTLGGEPRRVRWALSEIARNVRLVVFEEAFERSLIEVERMRLLETQSIARLGSWDWYPGPNRVVWTPELYAIFGVDRSKFGATYMSYLDRVHPDDRDRAAAVIDSAFLDHRPFQFEHRVVRPGGEIRHLACSGKVIVDHTGSVERMSGTCQDITVRKLHEQALMEREAELRLIVDQMPIILWTMDLELRNTFVMGAPLEALGVDVETLKGRHLYETLGTDDPTTPAIAAHHMALRGNSSTYTAEREGRTFRTRVDPLRDADGNVIGVMGVSLDVTDEVRAETELREAHENYRSLIEAIPAVSYIDSIRGKVRTLFVSPQIKDIVGFSQEDVPKGLWRKQLHPDDRKRVVDKKRDAYRRGESYEDEYRIYANDGKMLWVSDQAVVVRDEEGHPIFAQGIMYDITERKHLEDQLAQSRKMDALGRLTGGIAHDFNNLLTAILGNCYLVLDGATNPSALRAAVEEIKETAELGADVVGQLLGFSRRRPVEADVIDLREIVRSAKGLLQRVIGEDIVLKTRSAKRALPVRADSGQISQVILNLAVNAREAMPNGGWMSMEVLNSCDLKAPVSAEEAAIVSTGPHAVLRVTDSGTGMDEFTRASLFEPFFTTKERGARSGTGLGLSIVYGIVTRAKGHITVHSLPGAGSRISVFLPLEEQFENEAVPGRAPTDEPGSGSVLVVEDDERVRSIAAQMLSRMGYEVLEAPSGAEALKVVRDAHIDILLTDVVMQGMDGPKLAELLVAERPELRVVFMSGYPEALWEKGVPPSGATFIQKPFRREDLAEKLRDVEIVEIDLTADPEVIG